MFFPSFAIEVSHSSQIAELQKVEILDSQLKIKVQQRALFLSCYDSLGQKNSIKKTSPVEQQARALPIVRCAQ